MTEKENAQKTIFELYTKNDDIEKIKLSPKTFQKMKKEYVKDSNSPSERLYEFFMENYSLIFNEYLAIVLFPFLSEMLVDNKRYLLKDEERLEFEVIDEGLDYDLEDKNLKINNFLDEYNGKIISHENGKDLIAKTYRHVLENALNKNIETIFLTIKNIFYKSEDISEIKVNDNFIKETSDFLNIFKQDTLEQIANLDLKSLFALYNLKKELNKMDEFNYERVLMREQKQCFLNLLNSFKNNREKEIIIKNDNEFFLFMDKENHFFYNDEIIEDQVFLNILDKISYDFNNATAFIIKEKTEIFSQEGFQQFRVCGFVIHDREFINISKNKLKERYLIVLNKSNKEDKNNYRFFDWFYGELPNFN